MSVTEFQTHTKNRQNYGYHSNNVINYSYVNAQVQTDRQTLAVQQTDAAFHLFVTTPPYKFKDGDARNKMSIKSRLQKTFHFGIALWKLLKFKKENLNSITWIARSFKLLFHAKTHFSFPSQYISLVQHLKILEALQSIIIASLFRDVSVVRALGQVDLHSVRNAAILGNKTNTHPRL
jgi:hypothetical protein